MSNETTLNEYAEAKNRGDVEAALAVCHDDCFYESVGLGARVQGKRALRDFYTAFFQALPDYRGDFDGVAFGDGTAVVWGRWSGTTAGDFMGLGAEPGRRLDVPVTFVCTFRDGRLASDVGYFDVATLCDQAGLPLGAVRPAAGDRFVRDFAAFWADPDPGRIPDLVRADIVARVPGSTDEIHGVAAYQAQIASLLQVVDGFRIEVIDHLAEGDRVVIEWRGQGTVGGRPYATEGIDRFTLRDGKVSDARVVFDTAGLRDAVGAAAQTPVA